MKKNPEVLKRGSVIKAHKRSTANHRANLKWFVMQTGKKNRSWKLTRIARVSQLMYNRCTYCPANIQRRVTGKLYLHCRCVSLEMAGTTSVSLFPNWAALVKFLRLKDDLMTQRSNYIFAGNEIFQTRSRAKGCNAHNWTTWHLVTQFHRCDNSSNASREFARSLRFQRLPVLVLFIFLTRTN